MSFSPSAHIDRRLFLQATAAGIGTSLCGAADAASPSEEQELFFRSACTLRDMLKAKEASPLEVIKSHVERIDFVEPHINAVNFFPREQAIKEAEAAESQILSGKVDWDSTPLLGVPVSIKDMYEVAGMPTTAGARFRAGNVSEKDATIVRKLRQAGAIVIAITNTPLNHAALETSNRLHGQTNNPYDLERTPGGSSGGEAALIAAGGSPWGLGGDSGGSIRLPAHFCGVAGLVPSWGRVSTAGNVPFIYNSGPFYLRCGPMARYVEDLALMLPIISGIDPRDPFTFPMDLRDHKRVQIDKLNVAFCTDALKITPSDDIQASIQAAADVMRTNGANVTKVYPPNFDSEDPLKLEASFTLLGSSSEEQLEELRKIGEEDDPLRPEAIRRAAEWLKGKNLKELEANAERLPEMRLEMNRFMEQYDVLLCPVSADLAYKHGKSWERIYQTGGFFTNLFNLYGNLPTGTVRCGTSADGLPIGVQIVGGSYRDDVVLAVMQLLEEQLGGWQPPPEKNWATVN